MQFVCPLSRFSKCHGLTVVQPRKIFLTLRKILRFVCANPKFMHFHLFYSFCFLIPTLCDFWCDYCVFFPQTFKSKVWTVQKNLLLECLPLRFRVYKKNIDLICLWQKTGTLTVLTLLMINKKRTDMQTHTNMDMLTLWHTRPRGQVSEKLLSKYCFCIFNMIYK